MAGGGQADLLELATLTRFARPQVIPVFLTGLNNSLGGQIVVAFRTGSPIRVRFGPAIDFAELPDQPEVRRSHQRIADRVMDRVRALGEQDRAEHQSRVLIEPGKTTGDAA